MPLVFVFLVAGKQVVVLLFLVAGVEGVVAVLEEVVGQ